MTERELLQAARKLVADGVSIEAALERVMGARRRMFFGLRDHVRYAIPSRGLSVDEWAAGRPLAEVVAAMDRAVARVEARDARWLEQFGDAPRQVQTFLAASAA